LHEQKSQDEAERFGTAVPGHHLKMGAGARTDELATAWRKQGQEE
jgi:hypothetical protein